MSQTYLLAWIGPGQFSRPGSHPGRVGCNYIQSLWTRQSGVSVSPAKVIINQDKVTQLHNPHNLGFIFREQSEENRNFVRIISVRPEI